MNTVALIATLGSFVLFIVLIQLKDTMRSSYLILLSIAVAFYITGNYIEIVASTLPTAIVGMQLRLFAVPFIPTLWFFCVCEFCGRRAKSNYTLLLFLIIPTVIAVVLFNWQNNGLLISNAHFTDSMPHGNLTVDHTPLYTLVYIYQHGINLLGIITLAFCYKNSTKRFRKQSMLFLASGLIPLFNTNTYIVNISGHPIDITPYGLLLSMTVFTITLYLFGVLNLSQIIKGQAFKSLPEAIILFDRDWYYVDSNKTANLLFPELEHLPPGISVDDMTYIPYSSQALENDKPDESGIREFSLKMNGITNIFQVISSPIFRDNTEIGHSLTLNNITPLKNTMVELEEKSVTDPLTGLFNRNYLFDAGALSLQAARHGRPNFSVIMFDLDHFKRINDTYGHVFGDKVLKTIATETKNSLRGTDILARYGGEEFCILLQQTSLENARNKAELLRAHIEKLVIEEGDISVSMTASYGVAESNDNDIDFTHVVKRADAQLYKAKQNGRNQVC